MSPRTDHRSHSRQERRSRSRRSRRRRTVRPSPCDSPRLSSGLDPEEEPRVADRLARAERLGDRAVEMQEHRVLVAREPFRADRAFGRALLREPAEAREDEPAAPEEIGDERECENATKTEPPSLSDASEHELPADAAARRFRTHGERTDLREIGRQDRERAAAEETGGILSDDEIPKVLEKKVARALEHPILSRVPVDQRSHLLDVLDPRGADGDAHPRSASVASASASRT